MIDAAAKSPVTDAEPRFLGETFQQALARGGVKRNIPIPNFIELWHRTNIAALEIRKTDEVLAARATKPESSPGKESRKIELGEVPPMRIAVAMSGGVDSSVAALLLRREGADVVGLSMHLWNHRHRDGSGANAGQLLHARRPFRGAPRGGGDRRAALRPEPRGAFHRGGREAVRGEAIRGKTPIPCTVCNTEVKFKTLLQRAAALGCDAVATGHYARIGTDEVTGAPRLLRARDRSRDQSDFLVLTSRRSSSSARASRSAS